MSDINDSNEVGWAIISKVNKYLRMKQYEDGIVDKSKVIVYLGQREIEALGVFSYYVGSDYDIDTIVGCEVLEVKKESYFRIV